MLLVFNCFPHIFGEIVLLVYIFVTIPATLFVLKKWLGRDMGLLSISPLNVCFQTLDPLNSSSSVNFDEKIVNNCISNLYIPEKLVTSILQLSQTKFISSLVQEKIFGVLTSSKIRLRSLGVKSLNNISLFSQIYFVPYAVSVTVQ